MINQVLESLKSDLEAEAENPFVELFFKDISQYKYISQNPVNVIQFRGLELEKAPHASIFGQKGFLDVSFFHFSRTISDGDCAKVLAFFDSVRALKGLSVVSFKPYSHKKNAAIWEIKAQIEKIF